MVELETESDDEDIIDVDEKDYETYNRVEELRVLDYLLSS